MEDLKFIKELIQNPLIWLLIAWAGREGMKLYREQAKHQEKALELVKNDLGGALAVNSHKMAELTVAIVRLETRFESLERLVQAVPKLQTDISALHEKVRGINVRSLES